MPLDPYESPVAVQSAIRSAAQRAVKRNPALNVSDLIQQEYFHRFLTRIFATDDGWLLKGGASLLARIPAARSTTDLDLFRQGAALEEALTALRAAAAHDLGDFFRFEYANHRPTIGGELQPYAQGYRVTFDMYVGATRHGPLHVDLVVKPGITGSPEIRSAANSLDLPRLPSARYRLYPLADQIADKICASLESHHGRVSSREKDLVDLVLIAVTQDIDAGQLTVALRTEAGLRRLTLPNDFTAPATWGRAYTSQAKKIPAIRAYDIGAAKALMSAFVDPVLRGEVTGQSWHHEHLAWT